MPSTIRYPLIHPGPDGSRALGEVSGNSAAACVQIETPAGYLIRVLPIEQDFGDQPDELKDFITEARRLRKDWLLVPVTPAHETFALMH